MEEHVWAIREADANDLAILRDMLWEAAAVGSGVRVMGKQAGFALPGLRRYLADWGREGDMAFVACDDTGSRRGAVWVRLFPADDPGYGFVAPGIPELAIGVAEPFRGRGVGAALLDRMLVRARAVGVRAISLSVDRRNRARFLYERKGFEATDNADPADDGLTMVVAL